MHIYMGENIAVFSEKKAKTAIHPEISTLTPLPPSSIEIGVSLDTPLIGKIENEIKMNDLTDQ